MGHMAQLRPALQCMDKSGHSCWHSQACQASVSHGLGVVAELKPRTWARDHSQQGSRFQL